jgi:hypothetical protein
MDATPSSKEPAFTVLTGEFAGRRQLCRPHRVNAPLGLRLSRPPCLVNLRSRDRIAYKTPLLPLEGWGEGGFAEQQGSLVPHFLERGKALNCF